MVVVSSKRSSVHYPAAAVAAVVLIMATACSVLAFVVVSSTRHRQQQTSNSDMMSLFMADNLKSILSTSDYDLGVSEVNKGKVVKTAVQKAAKTLVETPPPPVEPVVAPPAEIVTSSSSSSSPPPPPPLPEQVSAKTSAAADSTLNIEIPSDISEKMSQPFEGLNGFLKTTQESLKASSSSSGGASSSTAAVKRVFESSPSPPAEGKALPLSEFMKAKFTGGTPNPAGSSDAALADSKEKLDILMNNLGEFFSGLSASIQGASQGSVSIGGPASTVGFSKSISDAVDQLPEGSAPWIAVGFGVLLLAAGTKKDDEAEIAASSSDLKASSAKLGDLTGDLEILQKRMREMEKSGVSVSSDLKAANEMLLRKELEISKERLKALDTASKLQRQIETLQLKLKQNDGKFQTLDKELMNTKSECEALSAELLKAKEEQTRSKPASPTEAPIKKTSAKTEAAPKKTAPKKAAPKKAAPKKTVEQAPKDELPSAAASITTAPKTSTKTKSKKKVKKAKKSKTADSEPVAAPAPAPAAAAPASGGGIDDWSTLSKSTLTRKTVKELQEYLGAKGVTTTESDGKPLKKALLVDAVLSQ
mmetsp:Transcript_42110/g.101259  ORF Transcript_42110/g.101259 Transcript_42110/m.101259 type:complete len:590 (+) Transcript_42110:346-2115(+)